MMRFNLLLLLLFMTAYEPQDDIFNWKPIYSFPFYALLFFIGYYYHRWLIRSKN